MKLYGNLEQAPCPVKKGHSKMEILLHELSSDDDADINAPTSLLTDSSKPWQKEFNQYLEVRDEVPEGMTLIQWWGVGLSCSLWFCGLLCSS